MERTKLIPVQTIVRLNLDKHFIKIQTIMQDHDQLYCFSFARIKKI